MKNFLLAACFCFPNNTSKKYLSHKEYFWGQKTSYTCDYECKKPGVQKKVTGTHHKTIIGSERGNEIVCDGTVYKEKYSTTTNWFYWEYQESIWFDGRKSKTQEIRSFCN